MPLIRKEKVLAGFILGEWDVSSKLRLVTFGPADPDRRLAALAGLAARGPDDADWVWRVV